MLPWIQQPSFEPTNRLQSQKKYHIPNSPYKNFNKEAFIKKEYLTAVLFLPKKAYDTTWLKGILKDLGLQGGLSIFIKHFLADRTFQVRIKNTLFDLKTPEIRVPQGSIISVILFMLRINKITTCYPAEINDDSSFVVVLKVWSP